MVGLGVADGVYGWKEQGIDSGVFSRQLMRHARDAIAAGQADPLKGARQHCPLLGVLARSSSTTVAQWLGYRSCSRVLLRVLKPGCWQSRHEPCVLCCTTSSVNFNCAARC